MISFLIIVLAVILISNVYIYMRLKSYFKSVISNRYFYIAYNILWVILVASIIYQLFSDYMFGAIVSWYIGIWMYILMMILCVDIVALFFRKKKYTKKIGLTIILVVTIGCVAYGAINAWIIDVTEYDVKLSKSIDDLKIVEISDTHYGCTQGVKKAKQMVEKINAQNPDIVCYAGDIFDGQFNWVDEPDEIAEILSGIKSKYGVYACWGNHDAMGAMNTEMREFLNKANITLLEDDFALVDNKFYVAGRNDARSNDDPYVKSIEEIIAEINDRSKPVIVMDHQPKQLQISADAGVDLLLCGHTHKGQTYPATLLIKFFWENSYGLKQIDNMTNITSSGVGLWGPPLRVGSDSEIVVINVKGNE